MRTATLENLGRAPAAVDLLDGLRNVLPYGARWRCTSSRAAWWTPTSGPTSTRRPRLGIFALTANITDRPEAAEELRANTVWCHGLGDFQVALSLDAVAAFRRGEPVPGESVLTGQPRQLPGRLVAELSPAARAELAPRRRRRPQPRPDRRAPRPPARAGTWAPGSRPAFGGEREPAPQRGQRRRPPAHRPRRASAHHFANVLFNNMRGGVFADNHDVPPPTSPPSSAPATAGSRRARGPRCRRCPPCSPCRSCSAPRRPPATPTCVRLCYEYLPLTFSRRHGDPSRPWNRFAIRGAEPGRQPQRSTTRATGATSSRTGRRWPALPRLPRRADRQVRQRLHGRRLQPLPHHPRRHRLGGARPARSLELHRLLGRPPDRLPAQAARSSAAPRAGTPRGLLGAGDLRYANVPYRIKPYAEIAGEPPGHRSSSTSAGHARIAERVRGHRRPTASCVRRPTARVLPRQPGREAAGPAARPSCPTSSPTAASG